MAYGFRVSRNDDTAKKLRITMHGCILDEDHPTINDNKLKKRNMPLVFSTVTLDIAPML